MVSASENSGNTVTSKLSFFVTNPSSENFVAVEMMVAVRVAVATGRPKTGRVIVPSAVMTLAFEVVHTTFA